MKISAIRTFLILCIAPSFLSLPSEAATAVTYYFRGHLTSVFESVTGNVGAFGSMPVGTELYGSFTYYTPNNSSLTYYSYFEIGVGANKFIVGPNTNYVDFPTTGAPGGDPSVFITVGNGATDTLSLTTGAHIGALGGQSIGGFNDIGAVLQLTDSTGTAFPAANTIGTNLDISNFNLAQVVLTESGYYNYLLNGTSPGWQKGTVTLDYFSTTPIPEPSAILIAGLSAGLAGIRRRR